ncbi:MAG: YqiJ family protein, partial [Hyphomicrobiaceae bacterium]
MLDLLTAPESWPFAAALGVMLLFAALELLGLVLGFSPFHSVDHALDAGAPHVDIAHADVPHGDGLVGSALEWLAVGRVPVVVLLISFLTVFGLAGLLLERLAHAATGHYVPTLLASIAALAVALPATRSIGFGLARVLPRDESEAVSLDAFVGKVATVTAATARRGVPAEAKLTDTYGKTHYIRVEPDHAADSFEAGSRVLVVSRAGSVCRGSA